MATYRAQVAIPMYTSLPQDVITNTFHFTEVIPVGLATAATTLTPILLDFYEAVYASGRNMADYLKPALATVSWYDLSDPLPRTPDIRPFPIVASVQATPIPTEVACVLSFQGLQVSGQPQARRRGRIYLGGLTTGWITPSSFTEFPIIDPLDTTAIGDAAAAMLTSATGAGIRWSVWSTMNQGATFVENGWVDNSPDTQRRRSVNATIRNIWP